MVVQVYEHNARRPIRCHDVFVIRTSSGKFLEYSNTVALAEQAFGDFTPHQLVTLLRMPVTDSQGIDFPSVDGDANHFVVTVVHGQMVDRAIDRSRNFDQINALEYVFHHSNTLSWEVRVGVQWTPSDCGHYWRPYRRVAYSVARAAMNLGAMCSVKSHLPTYPIDHLPCILVRQRRLRHVGVVQA